MLLFFREAVPPFLPSGPRGWPGQGEGWRPVVGVAHSLPSGAWAVLHPGVRVKVSERPLARALSPECHSPAGWGWRTAWTCLGMPQAGEGTADGLAVLQAQSLSVGCLLRSSQGTLMFIEAPLLTKLVSLRGGGTENMAKVLKSHP